MFKSLWYFIKNFCMALSDNTVGVVMRWTENAKQGKADELDKKTAGRIAMYSLYVVLSWFIPSLVVIIAILRTLIIVDIIGILGSTFTDLSNAYAQETQVVN